MGAELEENEKKGEKEVEPEKTSPNEEKAQENGKNDLKTQEKEEGDLKKADDEGEKKAEAEEQQQQDEEDVAVTPKKKAPRFWERLFRRRPTEKQDIEAGTELLAKEDNKPAEIIKSDTEVEKNEKEKKENNGTDVSVTITDADKDKEDPEESSNIRVVKDPKRNYLIRVTIALSFILLILTIVTAITIVTSSGHTSRGPLGDPLAITDCGPVKGYKDENGIYVFKGIPYALPPIGELRWKPPMQASSLNDCWTGVYEAVNSTAICYQKSVSGHNLEMSEDCLFLDVITPSLSPPVLRPVVVYIPGDHPLQGHTAEDINWRPTTAIADEQDVTFVTINYRTNAFGFLVLDLLTERMRPPTSGNYGIMDMIAALKWVERNIRGFGGDPEKVTILAHGGAATAGLALMASKKAEGLFNQIWLTAPSARFSNKTLEQVSSDNSAILRKLNCDSMSCLYNKTSEEILAAVPGLWASDWSADLPSSEEEQYPAMTVVDGDILYNTPLKMWEEGDISSVPIVIGSASQECGSSKVLHDLEKWSWTDFSDYVSEKLQTISENATVAALQFYIQNDSTPLQQFHTMVSDVRSICPLQHLKNSLTQLLQNDNYWYLVDYKPSEPVQWSNESASVKLSVHGLDIAAIFGILDKYVQPMSPKDVTFQKNLQGLFYSFVKGGRPKIRGDDLMADDFINVIGESVRSTMTPYENCHLWNNDVFYPRYAKMN